MVQLDWAAAINSLKETVQLEISSFDGRTYQVISGNDGKKVNLRSFLRLSQISSGAMDEKAKTELLFYNALYEKWAYEVSPNFEKELSRLRNAYLQKSSPKITDENHRMPKDPLRFARRHY